MPRQVVSGTLDNTPATTESISAILGSLGPQGAVISLLGPSLSNAPWPSPIPTFYEAVLLPLMRQAGVKRVLASATVSFIDDTDGSSWSQWFMVQAIKLIQKAAWQTMVAIGTLFKHSGAAEGLDWTVFRVAGIPGGDDEESWRKGREQGKGVYAGGTAAPGSGWTMQLNRARLARWVVDCVEDVDGIGRAVVGKCPALGQL